MEKFTEEQIELKKIVLLQLTKFLFGADIMVFDADPETGEVKIVLHFAPSKTSTNQVREMARNAADRAGFEITRIFSYPTKQNAVVNLTVKINNV